MKKFFLPLLAILSPAVFISCENFLSSNTEFREKISEEVKISTASSVNVVVLPKAGTGEVSKSAIEAKVGVPFMVQFFADENAEFLRWTAFSEYDETKTMDDQLGTTVVQYKNADNTNETGASFVKVEVTILKDIGQVTLVPWCGARPRVTTTEPVNYSTNVVRTTPIKIRFSKAIDESCISTKENPEIYKNYFELYQRDTANSDEKFIDLSKYFDAPVIKNEKEIWFNCKEKTDESKWLKAGSVIRFVVKGSLKDADGVRFDDTTSIEFTLGAKGDGTGPIIAISEFKNGTNDIHQTVFGNWEPRSGAAAGVYYADTDCRVSGSGSFSMKVKGDDSTTGDTGLMGFSVIQRLVYVPKGAYLPGTDDEKAASDMIPFDEGKTKWNYLSGILESDFKKETIFEYKSENTDFEKTFEIDEGFKTTSGKAVDGIYMFEVTALDGNSNYASNPCYYYVVRDTTAPDGKENAAKVKFTDDCGVAVNGKRFFGRNYRTVKFRIDGKISDFGTQGLPWTACKSEECRWYIALSSSDTELVPVVEWKAIAAGETSIQMEIPESYFADGAQDAVLYPYFKVADSSENLSAEIYVGNNVYIDVTKPTGLQISSGNGFYDSVNNKIIISSDSETVHFSVIDPSATENPSEGYIVLVKDGNDEVRKDNTYTFEIANAYEYYISDNAGNKSDLISVSVEKDTNPPVIEILSLDNGKDDISIPIKHQTSSGAILEDSFYTIGNSDNATKGYCTKGYTSGDVRITFTITENEGTLAANSLKVQGMTITKYKIDDGYFVNADESLGNVIPIPESFACKGKEFVVCGRLTGCAFDGSDDGTKEVTVTVSDGINPASESSSINLKARKPKFILEGISINDGKCICNNETKVVSSNYLDKDKDKPRFVFQMNPVTDEPSGSKVYYDIRIEDARILYPDRNGGSWKDTIHMTLDPSPVVTGNYSLFCYANDKNVSPKVTIISHDIYGNSATEEYIMKYDYEGPRLFFGDDEVSSDATYWVPKGTDSVKFNVVDSGIGVKSYLFMNGDDIVYGTDDFVELQDGDAEDYYSSVYTYELIDLFDQKRTGSVKVQKDSLKPSIEIKELSGLSTLQDASGKYKHVTGFYRNKMYLHIKITETGSGLSDEGVYFPKQSISQFSDDGETWQNDISDEHFFLISGVTESSGKDLYFILEASKADNVMVVSAIDNAGNRISTSQSLTYDGIGCTGFNATTDRVNIKLGTYNGATAFQCTTGQIYFYPNDTNKKTKFTINNYKDSTQKYADGEDGCGLGDVELMKDYSPVDLTSMGIEKEIAYEDGTTDVKSITLTFPAGFFTGRGYELHIYDKLGNFCNPSFEIRKP